MQQQTQSHQQHLKIILSHALKKIQQKANTQTIILTSRAKISIFSILTEVEVYKCGFRKIVFIEELISNRYLKYKQIVLAMSATTECIQEMEQCASRLSDIHIFNLTVSTSENKQTLRESSLKDCPVKGLIEENVDFMYMVDNMYKLSTNPLKKPTPEISIDRLVSLLCSQPRFYDFQIHYPEDRQEFTQKLKDKLQAKLAVLEKYSYKGYKTSASKTKVLILQRNEDISPMINSLYYGCLVEELKLGNSCQLLSGHSKIYNRLYSMDLLEASTQIQKLSEELSSARKLKPQDNLEETKKILLKNYNPQLTKQQINFHYQTMDTINAFAKNKASLICLQQNIANGITEQGEKVRGSKIVKQIYNWSQTQTASYDQYVSLVLMALKTHSFWWFQKNQLIAAVKQNNKEKINEFINKAKGNQYHLKQIQVPQNEERMDLFRHEPNLIKQFQDWQSNPKEKHKMIEINKVAKLKSSNLIIYVNSPVGYNEIIMLRRAIKDKDVKIVYESVMTVKEWTYSQL